MSFFHYYLKCVCASGSVVEHLLAKEGVAGSIPVSRFLKPLIFQGFFCFMLYFMLPHHLCCKESAESLKVSAFNFFTFYPFLVNFSLSTPVSL